MITAAIKTIAADIAPELEGRINAFFDGGMKLQSREHIALELCLWDNKVGLLRIAQAIVNEQRTTPEVE